MLLVAPYSQRLQLSGVHSDAQLPVGLQASQAAAALQEQGKKELHDGMDGLTEGAARLRFGRDDRLTQVRGCQTSLTWHGHLYSRPNILFYCVCF